MKQIIRYLLASLFVGFMSVSCSDKNDLGGEPFEPQTYDVRGKVEKGPFISGSTITIQPMDSKLQVLGELYNTSITNDIGDFILGSKEFTAPYVELIANGYFFNEVTGELSNGTLTLRALADLRKSETINVNILTHLKYSRIKKLILAGKSYDEANTQAQKELLESFGLQEFVGDDVSSFSIVSGTSESAALIATSSLLLLGRSEAALTEYLSKLSEDFGANGTFSDNIKNQIREDKDKLAKHIKDIRENIINRYDELGIEANVEDLSYYIDWDGDGKAGNEILKNNEIVHLERNSLDIPNNGGTFTINIESPIPVYLVSQVEDESDTNTDVNNSVIYNFSIYEGYDESSFINKEIDSKCELNGNTLNITVSELQSRINKTKTIILYDYIGNIVATIDLKQEGKNMNIPVSEIPLLGEDAKAVVGGIAHTLCEGLRYYNLIEQYYNYNKQTDAVRNNVSSYSSEIENSWRKFYNANAQLLQLKQLDEDRLNVYADYFNVLCAIYYSNLVYGWGGVPYIKNYSDIEHVVNYGKNRESQQNIFSDLKTHLTIAIENLPEKKNESIKDANGFFFMSRDVARVLLANIYMYQGDYSSAYPLLKMVVDNGYYQLDASTNFLPPTTTDNIGLAESTEVIFAFMCDSGTRSGITIRAADVIPYITLSDVYLSMAECLYRLGDMSNARNYINAVATAKNISLKQADILMDIKDLREHLLLYSGTYFAFLKRSGLAIDVCGILEYQLLFPIPESEMQVNMVITQNPGW